MNVFIRTDKNLNEQLHKIDLECDRQKSGVWNFVQICVDSKLGQMNQITYDKELGGMSYFYKLLSFTNHHTTNKCTNCMSFIFKSLF